MKKASVIVCVSLPLMLLLVLGTIAHKPSVAEARQAGVRFDDIDTYVEDQINGSRIPGVSFAIVEGDEVVHSRAFGNDGGDTITPDTPFPIGSLTKSFTALSVMQLTEAGLIDLDTPVQEYIPWFEVGNPVESAQITVRHLLNQTSGFSRSSGLIPLVEEWECSSEECIRRLADIDLNRPAGESYEYSNVNYLVLGYLVEVVSGQSYSEYVEQHIFDPLDMQNSYASIEDGREHNLVDVHRYWFGLPVETELPHLAGQISAGFLVSSAEDMARYLTMYLNDGRHDGEQLLSAEGIAQMHEPATEEFSRPLLGTEFTARYGMGWFSGDFGEEPALWHLGELPSFNAWMVLLPERNQAVIVLINAGSQIGIAGSSEVFSRIPIGITNLLNGHEAPTGVGLTRFYMVFDLVVLTLVAILVWRFIHLLRRPVTADGAGNAGTSLRHLALFGLPLIWEIGVSLVILLVFPTLSGLGWRGAFWAVPDLSLVMLVVAGAWLLTSIVRIYKVIQMQRYRRATQSQSIHAEPANGPVLAEH